MVRKKYPHVLPTHFCVSKDKTGVIQYFIVVHKCHGTTKTNNVLVCHVPLCSITLSVALSFKSTGKSTEDVNYKKVVNS